MKTHLTTITLLIAAFSLYAQRIHIPDDYTSIQEGIDNAVNGDTIIVAPGEYFENIKISGKSIFLTSNYLFDQDTSIISNTIINGSNNNAAVVTMNSIGDTTAVLNGFTITGGKGNYISDEVIAGRDMYAGGGIYLNGGGKIINNFIRNNSITGANKFVAGGGIHVNNSDSKSYDNCNTIIRNNRIEKNVLNGVDASSGAGIFAGGGANMLISGNVIRDNTLVVSNLFDGISGGGGITVILGSFYSTTGSPLIVNNVIAGNEAPNGGGVFAMSYHYHRGYRLQVINNTIADNTATCKGGALYLYNGHCTTLNNIIWNNDAPVDPGIFIRGDKDVSFSITQDTIPGEGNLNVDPLFIDTDYHLSDQSPAIDAGCPEAKFSDLVDKENPGNPLWPANGTLLCDMGAFGGNDTISIENKEYQFVEEFLYKKYGDMHYRIAYPQPYDESKSYPLTAIFHGSALWGTDNESQLFVGLPWRMNAIHYRYNEFTLVPQAPLSTGWNDYGTLEAAYQLINGLIDTLNIDTTKVVLTGWSQGGGATWKLLNQYPNFFSAGIPVSGTTGGFGDIKHIPVWIHHGKRDRNVSSIVSAEYIQDYEETGLQAILTEEVSEEEIVEAIENNCRLFYSEYPGAAHHIFWHSYDN